jgi:NDP-sugar pyrophosphorylase family protein
MKAVILAAGSGSRLQPYTTLIPKPLLPVGGKPCIRYIIDRLLKENISEIIVCVNESDLPLFLHELRDVNVIYSISNEPLGTAGELFNCVNLLNDDFLLHYGDELTNISYKRLIRKFYENQGLGTLAILDRFPLPVGLVEIINNEIIDFKEKINIPLNYWVGIAILKKEIMKYMEFGKDLAKDVFPKIIRRGEKIYPEIFECEWIDIGNISRYRHARKLAKKGLIK